MRSVMDAKKYEDYVAACEQQGVRPLSYAAWFNLQAPTF
jgi:hypothetical protein